jgi:ATP-binding cassette subfamily F protein uup
MPLLRCENLHLSFGSEPLLDGVDFQIRKGERICLVGRNGAGKSTLLKLIAGEIVADEGNLWLRDGVKVALLDQKLPQASEDTVYEVVAEGLAEMGEKLARYHHLSAAMGKDSKSIDPEAEAEELSRLQHQIDAGHGWALGRRVEAILSRMNLPPDVPMKQLSGGWMRRVILARTLVQDPDILLLDEPTNHMDIPMIQWLEDQLLDFKGAVLFVTHDRSLIAKLSTSIAELDRGRLTVWQENYTTYLQHRDARRDTEDRQSALFDKKLAKEEVWIRQGIKARRTRNEGRVRSLQKLRQTRRNRRSIQGTVNLQIDRGDSSGKLVKELTSVSHGYDGQLLMQKLDFLLMRGDRVGIIGANGTGKSTLLKIILGEVIPDEGQVHTGTRLEVAYFDQMRTQLDPEKTVADNIADGKDFIQISNRSIHVISYLANFLFPANRARTPVKILSGGETNRLLLAKLFSRPANLLVLDEPTNDLDIETLELLEELLLEFEGTVLLVTHDRSFLDNVVTSTLVFEASSDSEDSEPNNLVQEYVGGYQDWLRVSGGFAGQPGTHQTATAKTIGNGAGTNKQKTERIAARQQQQSKRNLDRKLIRELESLPDELENLEQSISELHHTMSEPGFYEQDIKQQEKVVAKARDLEVHLAEKYARWEELDALFG